MVERVESHIHRSTSKFILLTFTSYYLNVYFLQIQKSAKYRIVMVRHGESEWNTHKMFTGWYDSDLTAKGRVVESN